MLGWMALTMADHGAPWLMNALQGLDTSRQEAKCSQVLLDTESRQRTRSRRIWNTPEGMTDTSVEQSPISSLRSGNSRLCVLNYVGS